MKKYGRYLMTAGVAALAMVLFYLSAAAWGSLIWSKERIQLYLEQPVRTNEAVKMVEQRLKALEEAVLDDAQQEEIPDFCIWQQREAVLENKSLSRSIKAQAIVFCGNPELLFEDCRVPAREDSQGCLVDEGAAWELFGSTQVEGKEVTYGEKNYRIRKVLPGRERMVVFQAVGQPGSQGTAGAAQEAGGIDQESGVQGQQEFHRVTLAKPEAQSVNDLLASWSSSFNVYPEYLDLELLRGMAGISALLLPATASLLFFCYLCGQCRGQKGWRRKAAFAAAAVIFALAAWFFFKRWVRVPDSYIPAKWSDFSFWGNLAKEKGEAVRLLIGMPKAVPDNGWLSHFFVSTGCGILAELLTVLFLLLFHRKGRDGVSH